MKTTGNGQPMDEKKKTSRKSGKAGAESGDLKEKLLVVVESPAKAKTINKYLGNTYIVEASMGHVRDLPKSRLGVNVDNNFEPEYIPIRGRAKVLSKLKKLASQVKGVILATDPDREGEAISYHIASYLKDKNSNIKRVEFHEITEAGIRKAIQEMRDIDMNLVYSQQARRILDRLVGYNISPILWQKIKKGLSAGRVQSVALRLICEREEEIQKFQPKEYWTIEGEFLVNNKNKLKAELIQIQGKKVEISTKEQAEAIVKQLKEITSYKVHSIKIRERKRQPAAPYTTSKLQQDASNRLGFTSQKTMLIAQQLYEGVEVEGSPVGLITYMRTDSTRVSEEAIKKVRDYIQKNLGQEFLHQEPRIYSKASKNAQEAHEAIRPANVELTPERVEPYLTRDQLRLYQLIWQKFVASQMSDEVSEITTIEITGQHDGEEFLFRTGFKKTKFKGFTVIFDDEEEKENTKDLHLKEKDVLVLHSVTPKQHFTQPPPRYTDASLVKALEESGVGRPSTYAPTIQTLLKRYYVVRQQKALKPTELGILVNKLLLEFFPELVDVQFTAKMEEELDQIANSELDWVEMLKRFYGPFQVTLKNAMENMQSMKSFLDEATDIKCEKCGRPMVKKLGRNGYFLACSGFPECTHTKSISFGKCPKCGKGEIVEKRIKKKKARVFYGCTNYPECDYITWEKPVAEKVCPVCNSMLLEKTDKTRGKYIACSKCEYEEVLQEAI